MNLRELHILIDAVLAPKYEPSPELHLERCLDLRKKLSEVSEIIDQELEKLNTKGESEL